MPITDYRTALVTGASSGIGLAIAEDLSTTGLKVHAVALPETGLEAHAGRMGAIPHAMDVADTDRIEALIAEVAPDVLINNAGILGAFAPLQSVSREAVDRLIAINLSQAVHFTRAALPAMIERKRGHIVFTGSIAGRINSRGLAVYSATKAGVQAFAEGIRWDVLGTGIRVTVLVPGRVETRIYDSHFGSRDKAEAALYTDFNAIQPTDMARLVRSVLEMPAHVDVSVVEVMPTGQVFGGSQIAKTVDN
ncbi:MAG: SDR family oxidoreductase [Hyphomicrobiaceae bacterium]